MARLSPLTLWLGHWRGLSDRSAGRFSEAESKSGEVRRYPGSRWLRAADIALPLCAGGATVIFATGSTCLSQLAAAAPCPVAGRFQLDTGLGGAFIGGASLLTAGFLSTFSQLGSWRARYTERSKHPDPAQRAEFEAADWGVRSLIDEAVAHTLWGVLDAIAVVVLTVVAMIATGIVSWIALSLLAVAGTHLMLLTQMIVTRIYSAYSQAEGIDPAIDGAN